MQDHTDREQWKRECIGDLSRGAFDEMESGNLFYTHLDLDLEPRVLLPQMPYLEDFGANQRLLREMF